jgi:hypothetical protein
MTTNHKKTIQKVIKYALISLVGVYLAWVLLPPSSGIRVYNNANLPQEDVSAIIDYARSKNAFPDGIMNKFTSSARWLPWRRGHYFIDIQGNKTLVGVHAGFVGGPLFGGGVTFHGDKTTGVWVFTNISYWLS